MMAVYGEKGGNIVGVERVDPAEAHKFGIVDIAPGPGPVWPIRAMVEKPAPGEAPSDLYIMGRYILQPEIFDILSGQEAGAGGEIQITDAMRQLMTSQEFYAFAHDGRTFDCGSKVGFVAANIGFGLADDAVAGDLRREIAGLLAEADEVGRT